MYHFTFLSRPLFLYFSKWRGHCSWSWWWR